MKKLSALFCFVLLVGCGSRDQVVIPENPTAPPPPGSLITDDAKADGASISP